VESRRGPVHHRETKGGECKYVATSGSCAVQRVHDNCTLCCNVYLRLELVHGVDLLHLFVTRLHSGE
jgi:hypothetical protein